MSLQDVADRLIGILVPKIGRSTLDSVVSPVRFLFGESYHELFDFVGDWRPSWFLFPPVAVVPFLGDQVSVPTENGVGGDDRSQLGQSLSPQGFAFDGQQTSLVVAEQDSFLPLTFQQCLGLGYVKVNHLLLVTVDPTGQDQKEQLPGLQNEGHGLLRR